MSIICYDNPHQMLESSKEDLTQEEYEQFKKLIFQKDSWPFPESSVQFCSLFPEGTVQFDNI